MDQAHLHLVLNHFPILGSLFAFILLLIATLKKNLFLYKTGLTVLFFVALLTIPAYTTGEAAEHATEHLPGSSHDMVHEHEEQAELAFPIMLALGAFAGFLLLQMKRKPEGNHMKFAWPMVVLTAGMFFFMALIGNHGGKIRRPELRGEVVQSESHGEHHEHHDDDDH